MAAIGGFCENLADLLFQLCESATNRQWDSTAIKNYEIRHHKEIMLTFAIESIVGKDEANE